MTNNPEPSSTVYNLAADFSFARNPNGVWAYGYSSTCSLALDQFLPYRHADTRHPMSFWHPSASDSSVPGYYPYAAQNTTAATRPDPTNGWAARAGEVALEASNSGQFSLIRFTTPQAGDYEVTAAFAGIHFGLSTTDAHVLHNQTELFAADIEGYGGDPAFHAIVGASPTAAYRGRLRLEAGDVLTFAIGYGKNKTHYCDTTGLFARIAGVA